MFAIYDVNGRIFRDTLENLAKAGKSLVIPKKKSTSKYKEDSEEDNSQQNANLVSNQAVIAYRESVNLNQREPIYHTYQLMSSPVMTIHPEVNIVEARQKFHDNGHQQMPVVNSKQKLIGILSTKDLLKYMIIDGDKVSYLKSKKVMDIMSNKVITTDPVSEIRRVAKVMHLYQIHSLPVVDKLDKLIGIITRSDILESMAKEPPLTLWT